VLRVCGSENLISGILIIVFGFVFGLPLRLISLTEDWMLYKLSNYLFFLVRCVLGFSLDTFLL
jgi:hypothetical protein